MRIPAKVTSNFLNKIPKISVFGCQEIFNAFIAVSCFCITSYNSEKEKNIQVWSWDKNIYLYSYLNNDLKYFLILRVLIFIYLIVFLLITTLI